MKARFPSPAKRTQFITRLTGISPFTTLFSVRKTQKIVSTLLSINNNRMCQIMQNNWIDWNRQGEICAFHLRLTIGMRLITFNSGTKR